jgi:competence protein ComEA
MSRNSQWIRALVIAPFIVFLLLPGLALAAKSKPPKVDLNTASQKELEDLPGVGEATAKKIVAGRPYSSVSGLEKAGVPKSTVDKIRKLVTVSKTTAAEKPAAERKEKKSTRSESKVAATSASGGPVNLNTASQKELEDLPGVGAATAKKIIAGRPYSSVDDLAKAGVSKRTISKIGSLVTVGSGRSSRTSASTASSSSSSSTSESRSSASSKTSASESRAESAPAQPPPSKGMVWVNTASGIFHREGDRWYGNTKQGKYMTEADAIKAGYREAKR